MDGMERVLLCDCALVRIQSVPFLDWIKKLFYLFLIDFFFCINPNLIPTLFNKNYLG
jgi:hypothetical protein